MTQEFASRLVKLQRQFLLVGIIAMGISLTALVGDRHHFFQSYLVAYMFWLGLACLGLAWPVTTAKK